MLRDERQVALDCVIVNAKRAADSYDDAAAIATDPAMAALFQELSRRRDAMAKELEPHLRALGELPSDPDVESEALGQVWRRVKTTLASDGQAPLLAEAAATEEELARCIDAATAADLPDATKTLLRGFGDEIARDRARLPPPEG